MAVVRPKKSALRNIGEALITALTIPLLVFGTVVWCTQPESPKTPEELARIEKKEKEAKRKWQIKKANIAKLKTYPQIKHIKYTSGLLYVYTDLKDSPEEFQKLALTICQVVKPLTVYILDYEFYRLGKEVQRAKEHCPH